MLQCRRTRCLARSLPQVDPITGILQSSQAPESNQERDAAGNLTFSTKLALNLPQQLHQARVDFLQLVHSRGEDHPGCLHIKLDLAHPGMEWSG